MRKINQNALLLWVFHQSYRRKTHSTKKALQKTAIEDNKEITSIFQVTKETEEFRKLCKYSKPIVQYITHNKTYQYSTVYQQILRVLVPGSLWPSVDMWMKLKPLLMWAIVRALFKPKVNLKITLVVLLLEKLGQVFTKCQCFPYKPPK